MGQDVAAACGQLAVSNPSQSSTKVDLSSVRDIEDLEQNSSPNGSGSNSNLRFKYMNDIIDGLLKMTGQKQNDVYPEDDFRRWKASDVVAASAIMTGKTSLNLKSQLMILCVVMTPSLTDRPHIGGSCCL